MYVGTKPVALAAAGITGSQYLTSFLEKGFQGLLLLLRNNSFLLFNNDIDKANQHWKGHGWREMYIVGNRNNKGRYQHTQWLALHHYSEITVWDWTNLIVLCWQYCLKTSSCVQVVTVNVDDVSKSDCIKEAILSKPMTYCIW